jgi:tRNA-splicing ligase RtcB
VAATQLPNGVISPGAIGYDINCGVRLLGSQIEFEEAAPYLAELASALDRNCPSGVGRKGHLNLTDAELDQVCREGSRWALKQGFARADLRRTEEGGRSRRAA